MADAASLLTFPDKTAQTAQPERLSEQRRRWPNRFSSYIADLTRDRYIRQIVDETLHAIELPASAYGRLALREGFAAVLSGQRTLYDLDQLLDHQAADQALIAACDRAVRVYGISPSEELRGFVRLPEQPPMFPDAAHIDHLLSAAQAVRQHYQQYLDCFVRLNKLLTSFTADTETPWQHEPRLGTVSELLKLVRSTRADHLFTAHFIRLDDQAALGLVSNSWASNPDSIKRGWSERPEYLSGYGHLLAALLWTKADAQLYLERLRLGLAAMQNTCAWLIVDPETIIVA
jgi:hypothetical protein